jgi:DNA-binding MarR family transcriptional regulator
MTELQVSDGDTDYEEDLETASIPLPVVPKERYDLRILSSLRRIIRAVDIYSRRLALDYGVTVPQLLCLLKVDELGPLTIKDLSEEVYLNPSTLVGIVDRLENAGLFTRERSVRDRRRVRISLTAAGNEMVAKSPSPLQDTLAGKIDALPELERATIALSLEKILDLMESGKGSITEVPGKDTAPVLESASDLKSGEGISPKLGENKAN